MRMNWNAAGLSAPPETAAHRLDIEDVLSRLSVQVDSFSVGELFTLAAPFRSAVDRVTVLYVVSGEGWLQWSGGELELREGMIALIPSRLPTVLRGDANTGDGVMSAEAGNSCDDESAGESIVVASSIVTASAGHGLGYFDSIAEPVAEDSQDGLLQYIFNGILAEVEKPGIGSKCIVEALIKQVLIVLLRRRLMHEDVAVATPLYLTIANPNLAIVINKIQNSHSERLSISGLAKMVGMTTLGLTSEFERIFGETLLDYIQGVRLGQATKLLTHTDLPIKSIAASVGFASRSHFSRAFSKHRGQDPTTFRKSATDLRSERTIKIDSNWGAKS